MPYILMIEGFDGMTPLHCCRVPIESIWKNFVTLVHKFFPSAFIGNTNRIYMKKLVYKSYKVFSYRFYSFVPININGVGNSYYLLNLWWITFFNILQQTTWTDVDHLCRVQCTKVHCIRIFPFNHDTYFNLINYIFLGHIFSFCCTIDWFQDDYI